MKQTEENKKAYNSFMKLYVKNRYHRRMKEWRNKLGGKCIECSSMEDLEFDHIDPSTKSFTIGSGMAGFSEERIEKEMEKCQLLCHSCHLEKNKIDNGEAKHGSLTMYKYHKCKCNICMENYREYSRKYKTNTTGKKVKKFKKAEHGSSSMYSYQKCRCVVCREGQRVRMSRWRKSRGELA